MTFSSPLFLLALAAIPAVLALQYATRRRARRYAVRFTAVETLRLAAGPSSTWRRRLPLGLLLAAIAALSVALARPHVAYRAAVDQASVMLVTDHSGSMAASDVQPTRLAAAVEGRQHVHRPAPLRRPRRGGDVLHLGRLRSRGRSPTTGRRAA